MPDDRHTPGEPWSDLLPILSTITAVIAVLGWVAYGILSTIDADQAPDLPDALVYITGRVAETTSIMCVILLSVLILLRTNAAHTHRVLDAVANGVTLLKDDTGEIPGLKKIMQQPEIILVERAVRHFEQVDRDRAMRLIEQAEQLVPQDAAEQIDQQYLDRYRDGAPERDRSVLADAGRQPVRPAAQGEMSNEDWRLYMSGFYDGRSDGESAPD